MGDASARRRHSGWRYVLGVAQLIRPVTRFVGREAELARVDAVVEGVLARRSGGVLVEGVAGIGKTRLLAEAAAAAAGRDVSVARSACLPLTTALPLTQWWTCSAHSENRSD